MASKEISTQEFVDKYMADGSTLSTEHPSFTRAKALPEPLRSHFPKTVQEARKWKAHIRYQSLSDYRVMVVAVTRIECAWRCYIGAVQGRSHDDEWQAVRDHGGTLPENVALAIFPEFKGVKYAT